MEIDFEGVNVCAVSDVAQDCRFMTVRISFIGGLVRDNPSGPEVGLAKRLLLCVR